jgi:predicted nuclease of predicted toxin-antitoxin system
MKLLLDMNLSPTWLGFLEENGFEAIHWSTVGSATATDASIMAWARQHDYVVLTHDLDFSALLASTGTSGPSVILLRGQDVLPSAMGPVRSEVSATIRKPSTEGRLSASTRGRPASVCSQSAKPKEV